MKLCLGITLLTWCLSWPVIAEQIIVAVATNFTKTMQHIVKDFETVSAHKIKLAFGSSGKLYAQIVNGAPYEAFFSADQAKPLALQKSGLVVDASRFTYAIGTLALWSAQGTLLPGGAQVLKQGQFKRLALANPKLAPYGAAAIQVLTNLELILSTRAKWVQGENIAQTYQFVRTGNAELGFVALSQIMHQGNLTQGAVWVVPSHLYQPIRQDAVLLLRGEQSVAAKALLQFIRSSRARKIITAAGYRNEA